jgi:hypothetical protein
VRADESAAQQSTRDNLSTCTNEHTRNENLSHPAPLSSPLCRVACAELAANRGYGRRGDREYRPIEALVWDTGGLPQSKPLGNSGGPTVRPCRLSVLSLTGEWIGKWIGDVVGRVIAGHASGNRACGRVDVVPAMLDR